MAHGAVQLFGQNFEPGNRRVLGIVRQALDQKAHIFSRAAAAFGHTVAVLACEQSASQWTPCGESQPDILTQSRIFMLYPLAVKQVVLWLLHQGLVQMVPVGDGPSRADFIGRPFTGAPIERLALGDHVAHGMHGFFNRCQRVRTVTVNEIDKVQVHALERAVNGLHQIFAIEGIFAVDRHSFCVWLS